VDFNGATIHYPTEIGNQAHIYAYEWAPTGAAGGYSIVNDNPPPTATASYTYTTPGVYPVALKLLGEFGEYDETGTVVVQATSPPTASFTAPTTAQTGEAVSFDASASKQAPDAQISNYQWKFGDGETDETQSPIDSHSYTTPGTYTVTLIVHDNDRQASTAVTQEITITSPPPPSSTGGGTTPITSSVTPVSPVTTPTPTTPPAKTSSPPPKPQTTAQKLAAALKTCKKDKSKSKRATCEKQAKKKYATKPKAKVKTKAKKKKK
jgi:PKD repeat protein